MRVLFGSILLLVAGCEPVEPSGNVLEPVRQVTAEPAPAPEAAPEAAPEPAPDDEGYDFEEDERPEGDTGAPADELSSEELAAGLGIASDGIAEEAPPEPEEPALEEPEDQPEEPDPMSLSGPPSTWSPGAELDGSWGVRLVSTVAGAQPPRAILGLPDGTEKVVQPGTLLPAQSLVVMAIGRDVVQVAEIIPRGDHVRVETRQLEALYGAQPRPMAP